MKISIVILSYNDFAGTTEMCLDSLRSDAEFPLWDVIVVDNASDVPTKQELKSLQQQVANNVRFIFNEQNIGFAAGNNIGIKQTVGDVVVLLNSDTIVPAGMMGRLAAHFADNKQIGMIGPVTNAAGNEQCIFTVATSIQGKIEDGLRYVNSGGNEAFEVYRMDFHCVAVSRKVLDEVGLLDEGFGRGYYEDFDYSLRVKQAGFQLIVAEDVFIYHRGSASFGKMPREIRELLKRNKKRVIDKHGSNLMFMHVRDGNLAILKQYAEIKRAGKSVPEFRILNRFEYAKNSQPRSWLKRWRYLNRVRKLAAELNVKVDW
jgi:GT2 family glycosyltransferase